jgi:hypothetical protein
MKRTTDRGYRPKNKTAEDSAFRKFYNPRPAGFAPAEKDFGLRSFQIVNPEGEVHTVDTSDLSSPFYGPVWTRILDCHKKGEFLRGRAARRCVSQEDRFSGYVIDIDGVDAFLPKSKAVYFYDDDKDATNKCLALEVEMVHPNGPKCGNILVGTKAPWKYSLGEFKDMISGKIVDVLAVDYDRRNLIFAGDCVYAPDRRVSRNILVPIDEALRLGKAFGIAADPGYLTGLYWKLRLQTSQGGDWLAVPLEVLI